uniref:Uncharacterized protein n=1 Tax=Octopus bimaculoides TaxID=37653 RepID=A0A0L8IAP9_OCTBM
MNKAEGSNRKYLQNHFFFVFFNLFIYCNVFKVYLLILHCTINQLNVVQSPPITKQSVLMCIKMNN